MMEFDYASFFWKCFWFLGVNANQVKCIEMIMLLCYSRYTKPKGQLPDYESPVILSQDKRTVEDFCNKLHRTIMKEFK